MKKRNLKSLSLNKKSISQLHDNSIKGGGSYYCRETEACPSSWIYLCNECETTSEPPQ
ncbi:hypothetical protein IMCC3317_45790 [Kordia antarctica]|uniref:Uncharacterized protein n=1 Tax=Kordia antarctica TaxID=1218801 RepID=A0A7L4ZRN8_9FLAO|nr:hypothetical protein IMCC3317_45790 [Kordia antarctica]